MRVNLKCDKNYNSGMPNSVDGSFMRYLLFEEIVRKYSYINKNNKLIIDITEGVVDFYNTSVGEHSCKSAQSIAKYLRRSWLQHYAEDLKEVN